MNPRTFHLVSVEKGVTAEGVQFSDGGKVVIQWLQGTRSLEIYDSLDDLRSIRELSGRTQVVFDEEGRR